MLHPQGSYLHTKKVGGWGGVVVVVVEEKEEEGARTQVQTQFVNS